MKRKVELIPPHGLDVGREELDHATPRLDAQAEFTTPPTLELDIVKDAGIRLFGRASPASCQRLSKLFRQVWDGIPKRDRYWMTAKWRKQARFDNYLLCVDYGPEPIYGSCACVSSVKQEIWIESRAFERSTDERVKAIIAHELGHLRGHADPEWSDDGEAIANLYARLWGYKQAEGVYTTEESLELEHLAHSLGLNWQIFLWHCEPTEYFIYLRPQQKLKLQCLNVELGYDFEEAELTIRALAQ